MSERAYSINNPDGIYFVTFSVVNWIDIFIRQRYKDIIVESLKYCQANKGLEVFGWCLMSSHIHLIIRAKEGYNLSDILRDFKKFTSSRLIKSISDRDEPESRREWMLWMFERAAKKKNDSRHRKLNMNPGNGVALPKRVNEPIDGGQCIKDTDVPEQSIGLILTSPGADGDPIYAKIRKGKGGGKVESIGEIPGGAKLADFTDAIKKFFKGPWFWEDKPKAPVLEGPSEEEQQKEREKEQKAIEDAAIDSKNLEETKGLKSYPGDSYKPSGYSGGGTQTQSNPYIIERKFTKIKRTGPNTYKSVQDSNGKDVTKTIRYKKK